MEYRLLGRTGIRVSAIAQRVTLIDAAPNPCP
jgi:hypothetical protein